MTNTDRLINVIRKASELAHINWELKKAKDIDTPRCGICTLWMRSKACPKEVYNIQIGRYIGPDMNSPACEKFNIKDSTLALKEKRLEEINKKLEEFKVD